KACGLALRARNAELADEALEEVPALGEAAVVDLPLGRHDVGEERAPRVVGEGLGHQGLARRRLPPRFRGAKVASIVRRSSACSSSIFRMFSISTRVVGSSSPSQRAMSA